MKDKEIELFELCDKLANLLGDKEAIADLKSLYEKHPEMFENIRDVFNTITEITKSPEIIVDATHSNKDIGIYKAAKRLDERKMGDIVIKNDNGTNVIFHANKKKKLEFDRLLRQIKVGSRDAHFLHPDLKQVGLVQNAHLPTLKPSLSETDENIVSQENKKEDTLEHFKENKPSNVLESTKDVISTDKLTGRKQRK